MAMFNGFDIFGPLVSFRPVGRPNAQQSNKYFGVNGRERIDGGTDGGMTYVRGVLLADTIADLQAAEQVMRNVQALPQLGTLVDNGGFVWTDVKLQEFNPGEEIGVWSAFGVFPLVGREYTATFEHF